MYAFYSKIRKGRKKNNQNEVHKPTSQAELSK